MTRRAAAALNLAKTWALFGATAAAFGGIGWLLGGYRLFSIFAFCVLLGALALYWYADRVILGSLGARELLETEAPALHAVARRLATRAGTPLPRPHLIRDGHPRILSAGRGGRGHALVVTTGLLAALPPAELEGLVGHEIGHAVRRDLLPQTLVAVVASMLLELSRAGGWFQRGLLFVLGPIASAIVHAATSPRREYDADSIAAALCESPHGLADALLRLEQAAELVSFEGNPALAPVYAVNPFEERGLAALFATHPPTGDRVARLRALDPEWPERLRAA